MHSGALLEFPDEGFAYAHRKYTKVQDEEFTKIVDASFGGEDEEEQNKFRFQILAQSIVTELVVESSPQLILQYLNNSAKEDAWNTFTIASIVMAALVVFDAIYGVLWMTVVRGYEFGTPESMGYVVAAPDRAAQPCCLLGACASPVAAPGC